MLVLTMAWHRKYQFFEYLNDQEHAWLTALSAKQDSTACAEDQWHVGRDTFDGLFKIVFKAAS